MDFYHGTSKNSVNAIVGTPNKVDVNKGSGELGKGFYLGENFSMAIAWSKGRFGDNNSSVLKFDIKPKIYHSLTIRTLTWREVYSLWLWLKFTGKMASHELGYDVIVGNLAQYPFAGQHKFESIDAQNVLNNSNITIEV